MDALLPRSQGLGKRRVDFGWRPTRFVLWLFCHDFCREGQSVIYRQLFSLDTSRVQAHLRILQTTDLHLHLMPYDYFTDLPAPGIGLGRTAGLIRACRRQAPNCLLFDNGDFLQGNPLSDWIAQDSGFGPGDLHPMIAAMNALGYDGGTLGNHEFNYGLDFLERAIARAGFPIVSANITRGAARDPATDPTFIAPWAVLTREITAADGQRYPLRIGIIGFAPPQLADWDRHHLEGRVGTHDIVHAAQAHLPALRAAGADLVVALCHSGIGEEHHAPGMENAAVPLAALPGIDVVLAGHTHGLFPGPGFDGADRAGPAVDPAGGTLHGKPAVMAGQFGSHLGVVDLLLDRQGDAWVPVAHATRLARVDDAATDCDPTVRATAQAAHDAVLARIRKPVGQTPVPLHNHFALIAPDLTLQILADAQRAHAIVALAGTDSADLPLLSAVAPFRVGGRGSPAQYIDIPAGPLLMRHVAEFYPFPNLVSIVAVSGAGLSDWLERAAGQFLQIAPGVTDQPLIDPEFPCYNFDVMDGLTYEIDPTQPARHLADGRLSDPQAQRVRDIRWQGRPVAADQMFAVVTNGYRAGGGGFFEAVRQAPVLHQSQVSVRELVVAHFARGDNTAHDARPVWRFASHPGTAAWVDIGPGARACLPAPAGLVRIGPGAEGLDRYSLRF